ncbi:MAG: hypothetical protein R8G66_17435 [Cytophagales bacterium]|nr:hypothetical protein [Cytophagales bacterium]
MQQIFRFKTLVFTTICASVLFLASCSEDEPMIDNSLNGFFIVNEGGFGNSNTSLSYFDEENMTISNNVFQAVNGRPLGDQTQSMAIFEGEGFIQVQNSGKVEVIDVEDFTSLATIEDGISSPRYFVGLNISKGYVSDWGDGFSGSVKVIDLDSYTVTKTIETGAGANQMLLVGEQLYVANRGGFGTDNTVSIIDTNTDEVTSEITVGDNPIGLVQDAQGALWVLSAGAFAFDAEFNLIVEESTPSSLSKISNNQVEFQLDFPEITFSNAGNLNINSAGNTLYFTYDGEVYRMSVSDTQLPASGFVEQSLYGFAVDPENGQLIGLQAPDFSAAGNMIFYDSEGNETASYAVGIGPNGCAFE